MITKTTINYAITESCTFCYVGSYISIYAYICDHCKATYTYFVCKDCVSKPLQLWHVLSEDKHGCSFMCAVEIIVGDQDHGNEGCSRTG